MNRRNFLKYIPTLAALPFLGKLLPKSMTTNNWKTSTQASDVDLSPDWIDRDLWYLPDAKPGQMPTYKVVFKPGKYVQVSESKDTTIVTITNELAS